MRKITLLFTMLILSVCVFSQSPQAFKYQTVVRDANGNAYGNKIVALRFSILQDNPLGNAVYVETQNTTTNDFGIVNLNIGLGTMVSGNFSAINWGADDYFVKTEIDMAGGSNYQFMGTSQLLSVPYALFAQKSGNSEDDYDKDSTNELQTINKVGSTVTLSKGGGSFTDSDNQHLSKVGDSIKLTNGGSVYDRDNQTLSESGNIITLSNGGGSVVDHDNQLLSKVGDSIKLVNGGSVYDRDNQTLSKVGDSIKLVHGGSVKDNDNQSLILNGSQLSISNGNSVTIGGTIDLDWDPTNEIQNLSINGSSLSISQGNAVTLPPELDGDPGNELQILTKAGNTITLSQGGGSVTDDDNQSLSSTTNGTQRTINITGGTGTTFDIKDNDADSTNELQVLSFANDTLSLTQGNFVILPLSTIIPSGFCLTSMEPTPPVGFSYSGNFLQGLDGNWEFKASCPVGRAGFCSAVVNGKLYIISGIAGGSSYLNSVYEYDPSIDTWTLKSNIPTARAFATAAVVNDKIYVIGGVANNNNTYYNTIEEYDPALNTWQIKSPMSVPRSECKSIVLYNKIYVIGGTNNNQVSYLNVVEEFNPATNTWTSKASLPISSIWKFRIETISNKIYLIGGITAGGISNALLEYDLDNNIWQTKSSFPNLRQDFTSCSFNNLIYIFGGSNGYSTFYKNVNTYNPLSDSWINNFDMPTDRCSMGAVIMNNQLIIIGGNGNSSAWTAVESFVPTNNTWTSKPSMHTAMSNPNCFLLDNKIYVLDNYCSVTEAFSPSNIFFVHCKN